MKSKLITGGGCLLAASTAFSVTSVPETASTASAHIAGSLAEAGLAEIGFGQPAYAVEPVNDTYPWVNVNRHFGASIRTGRVVPVTPNPAWGMTLKDGGVYLYGSDVSGWVASVDGAHTFDNANSGRVFSNNVCGGYPWDWFEDQRTKDVCKKDPNALRPFPEGGPPSALVGFAGGMSFTNDVASGPVPASLSDPEVSALCRGPTGSVGCAKDVVYTANNSRLFFSPDAASQWFPVAPQCELAKLVTFGSVAADKGKPGHVVVLATNPEGKWQAEASGCNIIGKTAPVGDCAMRAIAYTQDIGEELKESVLATKLTAGNTAPNGKMRLERAGGGGAEPGAEAPEAWATKPKWRYATINNLPAPATVGGTCAIGIGSPEGGQGSVIHPECSAQPSHHCHGRKSGEYKLGNAPTDRDAWCLNAADDKCKCITGPKVLPGVPAGPTDCRYPNPTHLEIDPRNGWAYLSTDVGLLTSPDGGGHWIRQGGAPSSNPADTFDTYLGARMYTHRFHGSLTEDPTAFNSLQLNANPDRIQFVGHVSLAFSACGNNKRYDNGRIRGHVVATVPIRWNHAAAGRPEAWTTGVFVAASRADCDTIDLPAPGALEFWDSAHLWLDGPANQHPDLSDFQLKSWAGFDSTSLG